jgi:hypothetical protein
LHAPERQARAPVRAAIGPGLYRPAVGPPQHEFLVEQSNRQGSSAQIGLQGYRMPQSFFNHLRIIAEKKT